MNRSPLFLLVWVVLFAPPSLCGQTFPKVWAQHYDGPAAGDDVPFAVVTDAGGNVYVTGGSAGIGTGRDIYTAKYAADTGALLWERRFDGAGHVWDAGSALALDQNGDVIVAGSVGIGGSDINGYLGKYRGSDGQVVWEKEYVGPVSPPYTSVDYFTAVKVDSFGNIAVIGTSDAVYDYRDIIVGKYSSNGELLWLKRKNGAESGDDYGRALDCDAAGNVLVTGMVTTIGYNSDRYTAKYAAADGAVLWENVYNGPGNSFDDGVAIAVDSRGDVVTTGISGGTLETGTNYTVKYSGGDGAVLWEQRSGGASHMDFIPTALVLDEAGNVLVTGGGYTSQTNSDVYVAKYAGGDGAILWEKRVNGPANRIDGGQAITSNAAGDITVGGFVNSRSGTGEDFSSYDLYTATYRASDGEPLWTNIYSGPAGREDALRTPRALTTDATGATIVAFASDANSSGSTNLDLRLFKFPPATRPAVTTLPATAVGVNRATLRASVVSGNLATTVFWQLGTTQDYGMSTNPIQAGNGTAPVEVSTTRTALAPHTTYHYRAVATNSAGTIYGEDVTFTTLNSPPVAVADRYHQPGAGPFVLEVLRGATPDRDADKDPLMIVAVTQGARGAVATDGVKVTYTPAADYDGNDTFTYTVSDGFGGNDTATVTLHNRPPVAVDDSLHAPLSPAQIDVLHLGIADNDADGDSLTIIAATAGQDGTVTTDGATVTYTAGVGYDGNDSFSYTVADGFGGTDMATVTLQNTAPFAAGNAIITNGEAVSFDPRVNDGDADGDALAIIEVTQGKAAMVTHDGQSLTYKPGPSYFGEDTFTYTISDFRGARATATVTVRLSLPLVQVAAVQGAQVPGQPAGTIYSTFGTPSVGAWFGKLQDAAGVKRAAIFARDGSVLLKAGAPAAGVPGAWIASVGEPSGDAVVVKLTGDNDAVSPKTDSALYAGLESGTLRIAAREGDEVGSGSVLRQFAAFDGNGPAIFFLAKVADPAGASPSAIGLCASLPDGSKRLLVRKGDLVRGRKVKAISTLLGTKGTKAEGRWRAGEAAIGVKLSFTDRVESVFTISAGATASEDWHFWAGTGPEFTRESGGDAASLRTLGLPGFTAQGAAFNAELSAGGAPGSAPIQGTLARAGSTHLFSWRDGAEEVTNPTPDAVPGIDGTPLSGLQFFKVNEPVDGLAPRAAFAATIVGTGVSRANNRGLWHCSPEGTVRLLARAGDPAPGGGVWLDFESLVLADGPQSAPIFTATAAETASANRSESFHGLWAVDSTGTTRALLRSGDELSVNGVPRIVTSFTALAPARGSTGAGQGHDNEGHVAAIVEFSDRVQALVRFAIP